MYLKSKALLAFAFIVSIFSSTAWSADGFPEEGVLYKIMSKNSEFCLNVDPMIWQKGTAVAKALCAESSSQLWLFEKDGEYHGMTYYKIRNKHTEDCLDNWSDRKTSLTVEGAIPPGVVAIGMRKFSPFSEKAPFLEVAGALWYLEKFEQSDGRFLIKNKGSGLCLDNHGFGAPAGRGSVGVMMCETPTHYNTIWHITKDETFNSNSNSNLARLGRLEQQLKEQQLYINRLNLFSSSFINGAVYSLVPEVIRDGVEFSGYPKAANVAALVIQGGMIACNTASSDPLNPYLYASTVTGMVARYGSSYFLSKEASAIAGSTAAVVTTVLLSPETTVDCMTRCSIALVGSYAGSTLALKAKSWIYGLWSGNGETSKEELVSALSTLQKILVEKDKALKEKDDEIKRLKSLPLANY